MCLFCYNYNDYVSQIVFKIDRRCMYIIYTKKKTFGILFDIKDTDIPNT